MSRILDKYIIHFKGLKVGKHLFEFEVNDLFFEQFPEGEIKHGLLRVNVELDRHTNMLELSFFIEGDVELVCDRCLEPLMVPLEFEGRIIVKFGEIAEGDNDNDELWVVSENDHEISLSHYIYESICLSFPIQRYHGIPGTSKKDCDPIMLSRINHVEEKVTKTDPRWDKLNNLRN